MVQGKTVHTIIYDEVDFMDLESRVLAVDLSSGPDQSFIVGGRQKDGLIIIDECRPLMSEEIYQLILGRQPKKAKPKRQPDWARHNQAPRSYRRR